MTGDSSASDRNERLLDRYQSGATVRELTDEFNLSENRIRQILTQLGVKFETRQPNPEHDKQLLDRYQGGATVRRADRRIQPLREPNPTDPHPARREV